MTWTPWGQMPSTYDRAMTAPTPANDNMPRVVAFTGAAGAGKSTAARYLVENHGYKLVKFAGPLKAMMRALGLDDRHIEGELKETPLEELNGQTPRYAMQTIGSEWGRDCMGKDFWTGLWRAEALRHERVVCDDCRFPNEADVIRQIGGVIIKVGGRGGIAGNHESERGIDDYDHTIVNGGGFRDLHRRIDNLLEAA